jgi:predicted nuclease with TOPRIM domain
VSGNISQLENNSQYTAATNDKQKLFNKIREENAFLKDIYNKKCDQMAQLQQKKKELQATINDFDEIVKEKTKSFMKIKGEVEFVQKINVN